MAKNTRELSQRIRGVSNIQGITRAMELVAITKLKKLQERAEAARPYADRLQDILDWVSPELETQDLDLPLLRPREPVRHRTCLVFSSDRGLCGAYNANLLREVLDYVAGGGEGVTTALQILGKKAGGALKRRGAPIDVLHEDSVERLSHARLREITDDLTRAFLDGETDEVDVITTHFETVFRVVPQRFRLLPLHPELRRDAEDGSRRPVAVILEPDPKTLFERLLPKLALVKMQAAHREAIASEFASRRVAMKNATDNAQEMIEILKRQYNRARQEKITTELLEIVSGAEALGG